MKFLFLVVLICTTGSVSFSQKSVVNLIIGVNTLKNEKLIKDNHIAKRYARFYPGEEKAINFKGEENLLNYAGMDSVNWKEGVYYNTHFSENEGSVPFEWIYKWDEKDNLIYRSITNLIEEEDFLNEEKFYTYDAQNRMTSIITRTPRMPEGSILYEAIYNDNSIFPHLIKYSMGMELIIECEKRADTLFYHFKTAIPADLLEMARKEMGEDTTEEELLQSLGPLGRMPEVYCKFYPTTKDHYVEETYEENKNSEMKKISTTIFNSKWEILSMKWLENDEKREIKYDYGKDGKILKVKVDKEGYPFEYDAAGNILKEYKDGYIIEYTYDQDKLKSKLVYSPDSNILSEYYEYTYFE